MKDDPGLSSKKNPEWKKFYSGFFEELFTSLF